MDGRIQILTHIFYPIEHPPRSFILIYIPGFRYDQIKPNWFRNLITVPIMIRLGDFIHLISNFSERFDRVPVTVAA